MKASGSFGLIKMRPFSVRSAWPCFSSRMKNKDSFKACRSFFLKSLFNSRSTVSNDLRTFGSSIKRSNCLCLGIPNFTRYNSVIKAKCCSSENPSFSNCSSPLFTLAITSLHRPCCWRTKFCTTGLTDLKGKGLSSCIGPEIIKGVLASSIKIESTSSMIQK